MISKGFPAATATAARVRIYVLQKIDLLCFQKLSSFET
jgi:hypothetical protein